MKREAVDKTTISTTATIKWDRNGRVWVCTAWCGVGPAYHTAVTCSVPFGYIVPTVWNSLPADLRASPSLPTFKVNLKTHFFRQAF